MPEMCDSHMDFFCPCELPISSFPCCLLQVFRFTNYSSNRINDAFICRHLLALARNYFRITVGKRTTCTLFGLETDSNRRTKKVCHNRCVLYPTELPFTWGGFEPPTAQYFPNPLLGFLHLTGVINERIYEIPCSMYRHRRAGGVPRYPRTIHSFSIIILLPTGYYPFTTPTVFNLRIGVTISIC